MKIKKTEVRGQRSEVRSQKIEVRSQKPEAKYLVFFFLYLASCILPLSSCNGGAFYPSGNKYVAKVNDYTITEYDFKNRLEGFHTIENIKEKMKIDIASVDYYKILNDMIDDKLIVQEAVKMGLDRAPEFTGDYKL